MGFGPLLGGWIGKHFGLNLPFLLTGGAQLVVLAVVAFGVRADAARVHEEE